jgi:hypothetical protein
MHRKIASYAVAASLALSCLVACTKKAPAGESIAEVCNAANDGREVHVAGYLQAPILVGCDTGDCALELTTKRNDNYDLRVDVPLGSGPSTMTPLPPPKKDAIAFEAEEVSVSIRDANGKAVRLRDFVRISGTLSAREAKGKVECAVHATKIESL